MDGHRDACFPVSAFRLEKRRFGEWEDDETNNPVKVVQVSQGF